VMLTTMKARPQLSKEAAPRFQAADDPLGLLSAPLMSAPRQS